MTPKERAAIQQALEAIGDCPPNKALVHAAYALREALAGDILSPTEQAEQEPECKYKEAYIIWQDKTEWVQETAQPKELGMHRADVLRQRIENLQNAAPVRTKDLTDDEIVQALGYDKSYRLKRWVLDDARAVIAADREKNNGTA